MFKQLRMWKKIAFLGLPLTYPLALSPTTALATSNVNKSAFFEIERIPLSAALLQFADEADISVSLPPLSFRDGTVQALKGRYTIKEGLAILLKDTKFTYRVVSKNAVRIYRRPKNITKKPGPQSEAPRLPTIPLIREIIVSATRRADYVQKIPYAATAIYFGSDSISRSNGTHSTVAKASGIVATRQRDGQNKLIIRGISDGAFTGRLQSLVATYLDYSRLTYSAPDPDLALVDIDRVEILRGPQSTLYGSGALTGLYRVVTKDPSPDETEFAISSSISLTEHGDASKHLAALFNVPLGDNKTAVRAVASYRDNGGFIDDTRLGRTNVNGSEHINARLAFILKPSSTWHLKLNTTYRLIDSADSNYYNAAQGWLQRDNYLAEPRRDELFQAAATFEAGFDNGLELVSSTTLNRRDITSILDVSAAIPPLLELPPTESLFSSGRSVRTFINETHLSSPQGGRTEWILGGFLSVRDDVINTELSIPGQMDGPASIWPGGNVNKEQLQDDLREVAFFGEITRYLSQDIFVTAGLRWFDYDDAYRSSQTYSPSTYASEFSGKERQSGLIPKILLSWYTNDNHLLFAQVSHGYRLGGVNLPGFWWMDGLLGGSDNLPTDLKSFEADRLTNFELGWKATLLDDNLTLNVTSFFADWRKIQAWEQPSSAFPAINNVGDAHIFGLELDAAYQPDDAQQLQMNFSWNRSKITRVAKKAAITLGDKLPGAPEFSAYISARQEVDFAGEKIALAVNYSFTKSTRLFFGQQTSRATDDFHLLNMTLSVEPGPLKLTFFIDNFLASRATVFASPSPFGQFEPESAANLSLRSTPARPRTFGILASWRY